MIAQALISVFIVAIRSSVRLSSSKLGESTILASISPFVTAQASVSVWPLI